MCITLYTVQGDIVNLPVYSNQQSKTQTQQYKQRDAEMNYYWEAWPFYVMNDLND